jgi:hypothetical protein
MRRLMLLLLLLLLIMVSSCASTFLLTYHFPTQDNNGTCANPTLVPTAGGLVRAKLQYGLGTLTGVQLQGTPFRDSLTGAPGAAGSFNGNLSSGTYTFMVTCFDSLGNASCGAIVIKLVRGSFSDVPDLK